MKRALAGRRGDCVARPSMANFCNGDFSGWTALASQIDKKTL